MSQCPQCGAPTSVGQRFCGACGIRLAAAASPPPGDATTPVPTGRRRAAPVGEGGAPHPGQHAAQPDPTMQLPAVAPGQQQWQQPRDSGQQCQYSPYDQPPRQGRQQFRDHAQRGWLQAPYAALAKTGLDLERWLSHTWAGAVIVAGGAYAVALLTGWIVAFAGAEDLDPVSAIWVGFIQAGSAFGPDTIIVPIEDFGAGDYTAHIGQFPLLVTFLALGVAAYLFRRVTHTHRTSTAALLDAGRAAVVLAGIVTVSAILLAIGDPEIAGYDNDGSSMPGATSGLGLADERQHLGIAGAIFIPLFLLFVVLAVTVLLRSDWLDERLGRAHDWVAAPVAGYGALVVGLFGAGLVYLVAIMVGEESTRGFTELVRLVAVLPALGMRLLGLGVFSKFGSTADGDSELVGRADRDEWSRLSAFADDHGALFWLAPLVAIAIAAFGAWVVVKRSADRATVVRNVGVYAGGLLVVLPFLIRMSNIHLGVHVEVDGETFDAGYFSGVAGFQTTLLFFLLTVIVGAALLAVTGDLDIAATKAKAVSMLDSRQHRQQRSQPPHDQTGPQQWEQPGQQHDGQHGQQWQQPDAPGRQHGGQYGNLYDQPQESRQQGNHQGNQPDEQGWQQPPQQ